MQILTICSIENYINNNLTILSSVEGDKNKSLFKMPKFLGKCTKNLNKYIMTKEFIVITVQIKKMSFSNLQGGFTTIFRHMVHFNLDLLSLSGQPQSLVYVYKCNLLTVASRMMPLLQFPSLFIAPIGKGFNC